MLDHQDPPKDPIPMDEDDQGPEPHAYIPKTNSQTSSDTNNSTSSKIKDANHARRQKSHKDTKRKHKQQQSSPKQDAKEIMDHYKAKLNKLVS